jgi:hypothetical protein|tara:strand:+ start:1343 stop:1783 length:441 start_codon:yes stop_codon:yes gene_type:complete
MGIPFELITMLGSSLLAGVLTLWSQSQKSKQEAFQRAIDGLAAQSKATDLARRYENTGFQITRRIIALAAVFAVIVWPKIIAVFWPEIGVTVGYTEWKPGFLFLTEGSDTIKWQTLKGLVLTPLDTHLLSAIIGLYFGASMVKNAR